MTTDPIADMLTRIRNAARAKHPRVDLPSSRLKVEIARILKDEGYLANFKVVEEKGKKTLRVLLRYSSDRRSVITDLKRISRPGSRRYVGNAGIRQVVGGMGILYPARVNDWAIGAQARCWRRTAVRGLVIESS
jgi:small subunit ribosomal protein S8